MTARTLLLMTAVASLLGAQTEEVLSNGWRVRPAGRQVALDTFPMASALSPDGRYLLVVHAGQNPPSIRVLDARSEKELDRAPVADAWLGLAFAPKGNLVYVGGGAKATVYEFALEGGKLRPTRALAVVEPSKRTNRDFVGDIAFSPDGRLLYAAELYQNSIAVINTQSGQVIERFKTGRRPYRILFPPGGQSLLVSCWADGMVLRHETTDGNIVAKFLLAPHPTDMIWVAGRPKPAAEEASSPYVARVFVTASNTNSVRVLGVTESGDIRVAEVVNLAMSPLQPAGMTPSALALDAERGRMYVACSDENAVAVLDVSESQSRVLGYLPSDRYPTSVRVLADGRLAILNGGHGSASFVDPFDGDALETYTKTVLENSPYHDSKLDDAGTEEGSPVPSWPGDPTPIKHVVYIVAESISPSFQKLAREFVLLDNFRAIGDSLADGYNWSVAAISPDYVEKLRRSTSAGRRDRQDFEEPEPAAIPPAGYLWTNARTAKVPVAAYTTSRSSKEQTEAVLADLAGFEKSGDMPRLVIVRLTSASRAESDQVALGALVSGLAKSRFWPEMAIFIAPAAAGNAAFVVSPFVKPRTTDSTPYSTTSMLRTIELIVGLQPMTQFDAAARPMSQFFQAKPDAARSRSRFGAGTEPGVTARGR